VAALKVSHPVANYDRRSLGQLFGQLEQLMEDALGIKARPHHALCMQRDICSPQPSWLSLAATSSKMSISERAASLTKHSKPRRALLYEQAFPPKPFPKIPAKLLRNFSPRGPLYAIAATVHDVRRARDLKKFDLLAPEFRKQVHFAQQAAATRRSLPA